VIDDLALQFKSRIIGSNRDCFGLSAHGGGNAFLSMALLCILPACGSDRLVRCRSDAGWRHFSGQPVTTRNLHRATEPSFRLDASAQQFIPLALNLFDRPGYGSSRILSDFSPFFIISSPFSYSSSGSR